MHICVDIATMALFCAIMMMFSFIITTKVDFGSYVPRLVGVNVSQTAAGLLFSVVHYNLFHLFIANPALALRTLAYSFREIETLGFLSVISIGQILPFSCHCWLLFYTHHLRGSHTQFKAS
jgi:hypothetical protein